MADIKPSIQTKDLIVEFSEKFVVDRKTTVDIPRDYQALVFSNEELQFKINPDSEYKIGKENKDFLKSTCKIAFVKTAESSHLWGHRFSFTDAEDQYEVMTSGEYRFKVVDAPQLIRQWPDGGVLVNDMHVKVLLKAIQQGIGTVVKEKILLGMDKLAIANENTEEILECLSKIDVLKRNGVEISNIIIENLSWTKKSAAPQPIAEKKEDDVPPVKEEKPAVDFEQELAKMEQLFEKTVKNLASQIDKNMKEQFELSKAMLTAAIDEKIQESLPLHEAAKEENIKDVKLTTRDLIETAPPGDDYVAPAALIYSNIEENLIKKGLMHKDKDFVMDYNEYVDLANTVKYNGFFLLKHRNPDTGELEPNAVTAVEVDGEGRPVLIKMFPALRFIKAGMEPGAVKEAAKRWNFLNKIRHKNDENNNQIKEFLMANGTTKKAYLLETLEFFIKHGLYTRDK